MQLICGWYGDLVTIAVQALRMWYNIIPSLKAI